MTEIGKFIELEGEDRGRVKHKGVAEYGAIVEHDSRNEGATPEEANRKAEKYIGNEIRNEVAKETINEAAQMEVIKGGVFSDGAGEMAFSEARREGDAAEAQYKKLQSEIDSEKLDKLRTEIRETK